MNIESDRKQPVAAGGEPLGRASAPEFERIEALAGLGSFDCDRSWEKGNCSPGARRIFGIAPDAGFSLAVLRDLIHPADERLLNGLLDALAADPGAAASCHVRLLRPSGDARLLFLRAAVDRARGDLSGVVQDVTEAAVARGAVEESILLSQDMFERATWGMFQTTHEGRYLNANPALARIYGYDSPAAMRAGLTDIGQQLYVDPGRRDEFIRLMNRDGRVSGFESRIYRRDGAVIWISESCREVRASDGRFLYYEGTVDEITPRKRAEEALSAAKEAERHQKQLFEAALDNMSQGLCMFGPDDQLVVHNARFLDLYGLAEADVRAGMTLRQILERSPLFAEPTNEARRLIAEQVELADAHSPAILTQTLTDGRIITITHQPMADGGFVDTLTDVTEQRRAEARIAHMALHDPLTDLPNRALFRQRLEAALHRVARGEPCAVLCLDLDQFKGVNDTLGHPVGDALLQLVTDRLRGLVRQTDTVARLGGDEFAIVQSSVNHPEDATTLATRLLRELGTPYEVAGHQVVIGASIGIAIAPGDGTDPDQLLKSADMALYRAKSDGRNRYRYFEPEMDARMQARRELELELRRAVVAQEFELHYQPQLDLGENCINGFEALLRWNSPLRGMVSPATFISLAEEIGLIVQIGEWVLQEACREAATWPGDLRVAVNVSAVQFKSRNLVRAVADALEMSGLPAQRLEIEITESVMIDDCDGAIAILHQLKGLGVAISMDDFGTGYSSLSYLRSFPFDKIKIDQSFVRELGRKADCTAIIRAVTGLCDSLGVTATAEGVETEEQLAMLRAESCNEVQGYLISKPRPASDLPRLIAEFSRFGLPDIGPHSGE